MSLVPLVLLMASLSEVTDSVIFALMAIVMTFSGAHVCAPCSAAVLPLLVRYSTNCGPS